MNALLGVPLRRAPSLLPGVLLTGALAVAATRLADLAGTRLLHMDKTPVSPVMLGIVLGMLLGNVLRLPDAVRPGLRFAGTKLLRLGIILLGIRLSVVEVAHLGAAGLPVVLACVASGVALSAAMTRGMALPPRLGTLIGVGTSICGVSAIAATGPAIGARDEEVSYAVAVITVFGLLAMLVYPFVVTALFGGDPVSIGMFLGTAIHDTSQVNGAALIYAQTHDAPRVVDVAIVTKLVRNLFMIVVIPVLAVRHADAAPDGTRGGPGRWLRLFPHFVLGFLGVAAFRSLGDAMLGAGAPWPWDATAWASLQHALQEGSGQAMLLALSAVGLGTDLRAMRRLTLRPFFVGLGSALGVAAVSLIVVRLLATR